MMLHIDHVEKYMEERINQLLKGLVQKNLSYEDTMYERGKYAELTNILNVLKEMAAD